MTVICVECEGIIHSDCDVLGEYVFLRCGKCHDKKVLFPPNQPHIVAGRKAPLLTDKENG